MSSDDKFQETLAMGVEAEDIVYSYLIRTNSYVQDMRHQKHEEGRGPRLVGTEGELVLPDFAVRNKNPDKGNFLLDVKAKSSIYTIKGKDYFTVDRKYEQYRTAREVLEYGHLKMVFLFEDRMYFYHENDCNLTHQFRPNKFGDGFVYLFEHDVKKITY